MLGASGNDAIDARDGRRDVRVDGGPGRDLCLVDAADVPVVRGCEVTNVTTTVAGGGGGGGSTTSQTPFTLFSAEGTNCPLLTLCTLRLAGIGAKNGSVTVQPGLGLIGSFTATVNPDGGWAVTGSYGCVQNSAITLRSGTEQIVVATTCPTPAPPVGGTNNGPLTITSSSGTTCTIAGSCTYVLAGTGAEGSVNVFPVPATFLTGLPTTNVNPDGTWSATGQWTCLPLPPGGGQLVVADGGSDVPPESASVTTSCS